MSYQNAIQDRQANSTLMMDYTGNDVTQDLFYENITQLPYHPITSFIEGFAIPVISLFGLISNTLSSIVFLQKPLRDSSCSILLAARGFADNGFLSILLIIWISQTFQLHLSSISASCKIFIFLSYVCGCISVWLVVFITFENYIRICKPFVVKRVCTSAKAEIVVALLCLISACFYSFSFLAMGADNCVPLSQHYNTVQALVYADTVITLALPLCCISYLMSAIVYNLTKSYSIRNRRRATGTNQAKNPLAKVTKMLFAVTVTFFCLNLPSHINRLVIMISSFVQENKHQERFSIQEEAIQQITLLLSYLSLSTNIIVYITVGKNFRKVLLDMYHQTTTFATRGNKQQGPSIKVDLASGNNLSNNVSVTKHRSLTVLWTDKECSYELAPLRRSYSK
ncbi:probable G-protein coupled receptor 139 [Mercenaria mercenaria]|uniref:probable G-protein coupled receptor 139 n=1 Tax=Mercenaria mercenaria TaxID=6596 RepID=UPI00234F0A97|nr:probable G-protein coupled receptor 139 [Mercenaria mercenaria]